MGQKQAKPKVATIDKSVINKDAEVEDFLGEIPETAANICGLLEDDFLIVAPWDDPVERDFCFYQIHNFVKPELFTFAIIARPELKRTRSAHSMNAFVQVMIGMRNRSRHIPKMEKAGAVSKLIFGSEGEQQDERDPEWMHRPVMIMTLRKTHVMVSSLSSFSPNGCLPVVLALHIGLGLCRALASLHRAGFVHRFVTPYNFAIEVPYSLEKISDNMIMIDFSLAKKWPIKPSYASSFVGSPKYASIRIHHQRDQEPPDDIISVIFIVSELISGKLPWRAVKDMSTLKKMKGNFSKSAEFKRLPNEIRSLYTQMMASAALCMLDHISILQIFKNAIGRKNMACAFEMPKWLCIPYEE